MIGRAVMKTYQQINERIESGKAVVLAGLVILLAAALAGRALGRLKGRGPGFFRACDHFLSMQVALLAGFLRFCRGRLKGYWARTPRE